MNTKLLKKLRKEASKRYVIKRTANGFYTYDMTTDAIRGVWHESIELQKKDCKAYMVQWIADKVHELRRSKWKVIHYYPW